MFKDILYRITHWETWHWHLKYVPIYPIWLWYCLRARSFWFFTPSNPTLTFGGFEGENKREMYAQLPPGSYPLTLYVAAGSGWKEVTNIIKGIQYPFVVKPDVGMMGFMFRIIHNETGLKSYHAAMPADYLVQEYCDHPLEVSVFYYRFPWNESGNITGFIRKEFLQVVGDGVSTLKKLIRDYDRVRFRQEEMLAKHREHLDEIITTGKIYYLSYALNLSRGGRLVSLAHEKDDRLLKVFDDLSHFTKHFYYGRYDIKCESVDGLKSGDFKILEYNGCGAEPHHAYGNKHSLIQAYKIFIYHWDVLYRISHYNHKEGIPYWSFIKGLRFLRKAARHFKTLKKADRTFPAS